MAQDRRGQTAHMYLNMLEGVGRPHVSENTLVRIAAYATLHKDWELLANVAKAATIGTELDRQLGESDQLIVRIAWASNPGRPIDELTDKLLKDRRVALVQPLAAMENLDSAIYRILGKIKSTKLDETLAANPSVPSDLRIDKIRKIAANLNM